jgi:hypothetical protein
MLSFKSRGNFERTLRYLSSLKSLRILPLLNKYGEVGVNALRDATPIDTSETSNSWSYNVVNEGGRYRLEWLNSSKTTAGTPIVILLTYGHGTRNGAYVPGRDFINPAIRPILDAITESLCKEVTSR